VRQLLRAVVGACCVLVIPGAADAATGLGPDGERIEVETTSSGTIASPKIVELRLRRDPDDTDLVVWVARSSSRTASGAPAKGIVASCRDNELVPGPETDVVACRLRTAMLDAVTYYWWIVAGRSDGAPPAVAGPYSFTLAGGSTGGESTVTAAAASKLVTRTRFTGARSIKHAPLTAAIARHVPGGSSAEDARGRVLDRCRLHERPRLERRVGRLQGVPHLRDLVSAAAPVAPPLGTFLQRRGAGPARVERRT
jgi:hypothetical protein